MDTIREGRQAMQDRRGPEQMHAHMPPPPPPVYANGAGSAPGSDCGSVDRSSVSGSEATSPVRATQVGQLLR